MSSVLSEFVQFRAMNGILEPDLFIYKQTGQLLTTTKPWPSTHPEQFTIHTDHCYHYSAKWAGYYNNTAALGWSRLPWELLQIHMHPHVYIAL